MTLRKKCEYAGRLCRLFFRNVYWFLRDKDGDVMCAWCWAIFPIDELHFGEERDAKTGANHTVYVCRECWEGPGRDG
jgi:hypothetical protein